MQNSSRVVTESDVINIAKKSLKAELTVAEIYENLAQKFRDKDKEISTKLSEIAKHEKYHADFWKTFLERRGHNPDEIQVNHLWVKIQTIILGMLGIGLTLKILEAGEREVIRQYVRVFDSSSLSPEERRGVTRFLLSELSHEDQLNEYEKRFRFFINKISTIFTQTSGGLVIVLSTAIGLAGVYKNPVLIGVTGLIVGLTSAMNTVVGFYFFGRTGRRLNEDILERINSTCNCAPEAYLDRIRRYMRERNYSDDVVELIARDAYDKGLIEKIIAEEEYGIKGDLSDPMQNALWAGLFKTIGTVLPLTPYLIGVPVITAIPLSVVITLILISLAGSLAAIAAEVSVKDKIIELVSGIVVLASLTYVLGKSASFILDYLSIG